MLVVQFWLVWNFCSVLFVMNRMMSVCDCVLVWKFIEVEVMLQQFSGCLLLVCSMFLLYWLFIIKLVFSIDGNMSMFLVCLIRLWELLVVVYRCESMELVCELVVVCLLVDDIMLELCVLGLVVVQVVIWVLSSVIVVSVVVWVMMVWWLMRFFFMVIDFIVFVVDEGYRYMCILVLIWFYVLSKGVY